MFQAWFVSVLDSSQFFHLCVPLCVGLLSREANSHRGLRAPMSIDLTVQKKKELFENFENSWVTCQTLKKSLSSMLYYVPLSLCLCYSSLNPLLWKRDCYYDKRLAWVNYGSSLKLKFETQPTQWMFHYLRGQSINIIKKSGQISLLDNNEQCNSKSSKTKWINWYDIPEI